jgi:transposase IS66 family protein
VWFAYTPDRKGEHPKAHLREFTGTLQADGYAGYDAIYEGGQVNEAACMAHVRKLFYDLYDAHKSAGAQEALERIAAVASPSFCTTASESLHHKKQSDRPCFFVPILGRVFGCL